MMDSPSNGTMHSPAQLGNIASRYQLDIGSVEDVYPCTPMQEGLLSLTSRRPGDYIVRAVLELSCDTSISALRAAWKMVIRAAPILRTRIVSDRQHGLLQVVLKEEEAEMVQWDQAGDLERYLKEHATLDDVFGQPLSRYALVESGVGHKRWFVWTVHHALFDDWTLTRLTEMASRAYHGQPIARQGSFRAFVDHLGRHNATEDARVYWRSALRGAEPLQLVTSPRPIHGTDQRFTIELRTQYPRRLEGTIISTLLVAAWAMVLDRHAAGAQDVVFGTTVSGRRTGETEVDEALGPAIATIPVRIRVRGRDRVSAFLEAIQRDATERIPHESLGLGNIAKVEGCARACEFDSLFVVQRAENDLFADPSIGKWITGSKNQQDTTYGMTVQCFLAAGYIKTVADCGTGVIDEWVAQRMLEQHAFVLQQLATASPEQTVAEIEILTARDREDLWKRNMAVPPAIEQCVHDIIGVRAQAQPGAPAICAWDGELTYGELDELASRLAHHLVGLGVGPEVLVPLCFPKSMWTVVAMLAVLKAGGAFVPLDSAQSVDRRARIVATTGASVILTSAGYTDLFPSDTKYIIFQVTRATLESIPTFPPLHSNDQSGRTSPACAAYVLFTSGSTGQPKGVVIEHRAASSGCSYHGARMRFDTSYRMLQFAAYTFDASILEIVTTLIYGGCICIPSDSDRMGNLEESSEAMAVNIAHFTPFLARHFEPSRFPSLKVLIMGGDKVEDDDFRRWWDSRTIFHTYGPTECAIISVMNEATAGVDGIPTAIGRAVGSVSWVVDPRDYQKLAPPGAVGELLVEGPIVGRGYLGDPGKTAAAFVEDPPWLLQGMKSSSGAYPGRHGRLYRTGDLVRHNENGTLSYVGRRDTQVKIRGQRVELGEVEHQVRECILQATQVIADVIAAPNGAPALAAFLLMSTGVPGVFVPPAAVERKIAERLPVYMVPAIYLTVTAFPTTTTDKIDRRRLREVGASLATQQQKRSDREIRQPTTHKQHTLQRIWAQVLGVQVATIGIDDSFVRLGGDSIAAMKLVGEARQAGMALTAADIFRHPKLVSLAEVMKAASGSSQEVAPFSLLDGDPASSAHCREQIAVSCEINAELIEDVYPCTPLQEGLLALTAKRPGNYTLRNVLQLRAGVDLDAFCRAWNEVVLSNATLRTRIAHHRRLGLVQVVVQEGIRWQDGVSLKEYIEQDKGATMELGRPLARYALIHESTTGQSWFVWTAHHALYDGISLSLVAELVNQAYQGLSLGERPRFNLFVKHIREQDRGSAEEYWRSAFADYEHTAFPSLPPSLQEPRADAVVEWQCLVPAGAGSDTTLASLVRGAWAMVTHSYTGASDVVFGETVMGRSAPVAGIEEMVGPTIATVPRRVRISAGQTVASYLEEVQSSVLGMIPFEHTGLQQIAKASPEAGHACEFQTLLVIQPPGNDFGGDDTLGTWREEWNQLAFTTYAVTLECFLSRGAIRMVASFDSRVVSPWAMEKWLQQHSFLLQQLAGARPDQKLTELELVTPADQEILWAWNATVPTAVERCVHDMIIEDQAQFRPKAPAVHAWDGRLTYGELDAVTSRLGGRLVELGIQSGDIVPLAFEKSMWTSVAMLAVLRAGGAFVLIDPSQPEQRLRTIVQSIGATVILTSTSSHLTASRLAKEVVVVGWGLLTDNIPSPKMPLPRQSPSSPMYLVFTSGSTGEPKGAIIHHAAFASVIHYQAERVGFRTSSRVFDFASNIFDVEVFNVMTTFATGGCLCVPSDRDRKDNLAGTINSMGATIAYLTPSVARLLDPDSIPTVSTMILGGESLSVRDAARWCDQKRVVNAYGPSECTPNGLLNLQATDAQTAARLGKGVGVVTWVVDPSDHQRLLPIGATGELLLEGPLLGRGYVNDSEKTAAAFVEQPAWLVRGRGQGGKVYKTGDLVSYNADGSLSYVKRKDTQVKIRGQRVELGEVEHHIRECMVPGAKHVAAEVIVPAGKGAVPTLAAFLVLDGGPDGEANGGPTAAQILPKSSGIEDKLAGRLPAYMIPAVYFVIPELPMTTTGKVWRRRLHDIGASFTAQQLADLRNAGAGKKRMPGTAIERKLQRLWAQVLNINETSIGLDDSFLRLGGDSITAMQVSSAARGLRLSLTTSQILREKTIGRLAQVMPSANGTPTPLFVDEEEHVGKAFGLSPIQHVFMQLQGNKPARFDQSFFFKLGRTVSLDALQYALGVIVQRHSMLRARFRQDEGGRWEQYITVSPTDSYRAVDLGISTAAEVVQAIGRSRETLDVERGPLVVAVLANEVPHGQSLFLAIHHLVVDLVSWRVLLQELELELSSKELPHLPAVAYRNWCSLQAEHENEKEVVLPFEVRTASYSYWGMESVPTLQDVVDKQFTLGKHESSGLLGAGNDAFRTRPVELMIAAIIHSFGLEFSDRPVPTVFNEGHGRETWDEAIDLSRTVGWFTTASPVQISDAEDGRDVLDKVRLTKDAIRSLPPAGWSYLVSEEARAHFPVEIMFNYAGRYQQFEQEDSLFKRRHFPDGYNAAPASPVPRFALLDIGAEVTDSCIKFSIAYDRAMHHQERLGAWVRRFETVLVEMIALLTDRPPEWTLSDFPLAFTSYASMNGFRVSLLPRLGIHQDDIEDVFPCSPMQQGMLVSQAVDPSRYQSRILIEALATRDGERVNVAALQRAWQAIVKRHGLLRAVVTADLPGNSGYACIVLKDPKPCVSVHQRWGDTTRPAQLFMERHQPAGCGTEPAGLNHHLSIYQIDDRQAYLCIDINHAIIDGYSREMLLRDLQAVLGGAELDPRGGQYSSFISYLNNQQSHTVARDYWVKHLAGVEPCYFPDLGVGDDAKDSDGFLDGVVGVPNLDADAVHAFCLEWEITPATVVQVAWALVLARYTGTATPCFGHITSGRDLPVADASDIFGPLIGMLTCRIQLDKAQTVLATLRQAQEDYLSSLAHQTFPLADVHNSLELGASALFNTVVSLQRAGPTIDDDKTPDVTLAFAGGLDPTEYDISLSVGYGSAVLEGELTYRAHRLTPGAAERIAGSLSKAIREITNSPGVEIHTLDVLAEAEQNKIGAWNGAVPPTVERCVHDLVEERARTRPAAPAVNAWDGELTYGELDSLASRLASHLVGRWEVGPEVIVPIFFEKSTWAVVAMLAVLKAGGAFVPLDPSQAADRRERLLVQTGARVVLTSASYAKMSLGHACAVFPVTRNSIEVLADPANRASRVTPASAAYVLFTSGSTGQPKGVVLEHRAVSSSCTYHGARLGLNTSSRTLQFANYTFDACIFEIFTTLVHGGCVCVPSESDRLDDLGKCINALMANTAFFTPSIARLLEPSLVPDLHTVILGGEKVSDFEFERWADHRKLFNGYGPTECAVFCVMNEICRGVNGVMSSSIGTAIGSVSWIVDLADPTRLAPIGTVGELLIEGPQVARGYLHDRARTAAAFVEDPPWLLQAGRRGRLYKTGDLVRYTEDGSLQLMGRNDAQVKIHGQRLELGEVEYNLQRTWPQASQVAAEVVVPAGGGTADQILAAFLVLETDATNGEVNQEASASTARVISIAPDKEEALAGRLPRYMMPAIYLAVREIPLTKTDKVDRRRLREMASSFTMQQLAGLRAVKLPKEQGQLMTDNERLMQSLWGKVLRIDAASIGSRDSFFRLGGDSLMAMKLAGEARRIGLALSVADVFRHSRLADLAAAVTAATTRGDDSYSSQKPALFSLLPDADRELLVSGLQTSGSEIEDILPVTAFQEGFLRHRRSRINYLHVDLGSQIDRVRLQDSCRELLKHFPILRSTFMFRLGRYWQLVPKNTSIDLDVFETDGQDPMAAARSIIASDARDRIELGRPFVSFMLIHHPAVGYRLVVRMSHAQYDGVCLPVIIQSLFDIYHGKPLEPHVDFSLYLAHVRDQRPSAAAYWRALLQGSYLTRMIPNASTDVADGIGGRTVQVERSIEVPVAPSNTTTASLFSAAWAVILSYITGEGDVVYGTLVSGRNAAIPGIQGIVGPCVNEVPTRAPVCWDRPAMELIQSIQDQQVSLGQADCMGLADIIKDCMDWSAGTSFDSVVEHSNADLSPGLSFGQHRTGIRFFEQTPDQSHTIVRTTVEDDTVRVSIIFGRRHAVDPATSEAILGAFLHIVAALSANPSMKLTELPIDLSTLTKTQTS